MPQASSKGSSGQEQHQTAQTFPYSFPYPQQSEDDTIDLYELWITLWNRKWLVIVVTVVFALGSIVYALQLQSIYRAEALLLPPKAKDIQSLSFFEIQKSGDESEKLSTFAGTLADNIFKKFKQNLISRDLQKKFIQEKGLMELLAPERTPETSVEEIYKSFAELINIVEKNGITTFSIELYDAKIAPQLVNDLTEFIDKETIAMLVDDLRNSIANQIRGIEYAIASKRKMAKQRREDQVIRYYEAAEIAESLGIRRRVDATNIIQNTQMNVDIATATTPLYYLGFEALMTEINILQNRKSDDPFIAGLRDLQERLTLLRSIKFDEEKMSTVHIDQAAYEDNKPIKPNRRRIVSLSTFIGLFLGIFLVFFVQFVQNQIKLHLK